MAKFNTTITNYGAQVLTELLALGSPLVLTRAAVGDGRFTGGLPQARTNLVSPRPDIQVNLGDKEIVEGEETMICIPIQTTNKGLTTRRYVREIGLYADDRGTEILFAYCWMEGEDADNVLDVSGFEDKEADTIHIHDIGLLVTNQEAEAITVSIGGGTYVSREELLVYAAEKEHRHTAAEISETTGENVEVVQRRQDYDIAALKEQLDTGFTGTTLTHTVQAAELAEWTGYDGTGYPEGIYDTATARLYA